VSEKPPVRAPRAYRLPSRGFVAGVAAGLSTHLHLPVWVLRSVFLLGCGWKFSGVIAYGLLWFILSPQPKNQPVGLRAAELQGKRPLVRRPRWRRFVSWCVVVVAMTAIAFAMRFYDTSWIGRDAIIIAILAMGLSLVWLTWDDQWPKIGAVFMIALGVFLTWVSASILLAHRWFQCGNLPWCARLTQGWPQSWTVFHHLSKDSFHASDGYLFVGFIAAGVFLVAAVAFLPWLMLPARGQEDKLQELMEITRAEFAAYLHDSVLQTLAVIQKRSTQSQIVVQLARHQEKELRDWLYADPVEGESAKTALKEVIAEVEATYPVAVELVTVGDHDMIVEVDAVVRAAREAIINAAKHSGAHKVDVYAEFTEDHGEVFVRDRGRGFDTGDVDQDRRGIRGSIIDRITRYGGEVDIRSTHGEGTQIHLSMPWKKETRS